MVKACKKITGAGIQKEIEVFWPAVFEPGDIVEVRRLPSGVSSWHKAEELPTIAKTLLRQNNKGVNIFVGANPRRQLGGKTNEHVACWRCLFVDFDNVSQETVQERLLESALPAPTMIIASGHGYHVYWRLSEPITDIACGTQSQKKLIVLLGSDKSVHDASRIMRAPGLLNHKQPAAPCRIVEAHPDRRYDLEEITSILDLSDPPASNEKSASGDPANAVDNVVAVKRATAAAATWDTVAKGDRNSTALRRAAYLVKDFGLSEADAWQIMMEWNDRNDPPLPEPELRKCLANAVKYGQHTLGSELNQTPYGVNSVNRVTTDTGIYRPAWPEPLAEEAYYGLAGEATRIIEPHSEADPTAILIQFLVFFGNLIGKSAYFVAEGAKHHLNLFTVLVGATSKGRKGSSMAHVRNIFARADEHWVSLIQSGLSSGEGLIWAVRDPIYRIERDKKSGTTEEVLIDPGIDDKRLLVIESEFASVLRVAAREGNTLSAIVRNAWDGGTLQTMTKNNPAKATGAHISLVGHIVKEELCRYMTTTEAGNGFGNRFLWLGVKRSKALPEGGSLNTDDLTDVISGIIEAKDYSNKTGQMKFGADALRIWKKIYPDLSEGIPGLLGAMTSRAEAQVMRLACIYALLDQSPVINSRHLLAALAIWDYCEASAKHIFGSSLGDPIADEILRVLKAASEGLTRNDIRNHFGRNQSAARITHALAELLDNNLAYHIQEQTDGRPAERWFAGNIQYAVNAINAVSPGICQGHHEQE